MVVTDPNARAVSDAHGLDGVASASAREMVPALADSTASKSGLLEHTRDTDA